MTSDGRFLEDLLPLATILLVILVQVYFWFPTSPVKKEEPHPVGTGVSNGQESSVSLTLLSGLPSRSLTTRSDGSSPTSTKASPRTASTEDDTTASETIDGEVSKKPKEAVSLDSNKDEEDLFKMNDAGNWRCACEGGFLPPGMLKTFGSAEAMMRLGTGQCYHKQM
mmetsp:Transcript_33115/g.55510  ORF Transcript_33115/g.55510 Transcript_33115/m.55510 type:complete len:167 (+) Transcript_33115:176-676(+)